MFSKYKIHWLIKYYAIGVSSIFLIVWIINTKEPYVNWQLYDSDTRNTVELAVKNGNCSVLVIEYNNEFTSEYYINRIGFIVRKDKKLSKGLNLLKYLKYKIEDNRC